MATAVKRRWKWIALIAFLQATLLVSLAIAQTESEFKNGWESSDFGPVIKSATATNAWQEENGSEEAAPSVAPFDGNGQEAGNGESSGEEFSLVSYFDNLKPEEKSKFSWNLANGWTITPFGYLRGEFIYSQNPTAADAAIIFFAPNSPGVDDDSATLHAKTSFLNFALTGPKVCGWDSGGLIAINFLGPQPIRNQSGFNVVNAFGYLQNDGWRLSAGRMTDLFSPINPTTVNITAHRGAGNVGIFRGGLNIDRYVQKTSLAKWTLSARMSQNVINDYLLLPTARGTDNGFPNFEGRIGLEFGREVDGKRPVELGISGLWGETRAFDPARFDESTGEITILGALEEVSTTAGINLDFQFRGPRVGMNGEFWAAQAAGTYFVAALQSLNPVTGRGIRSVGGWVETYYRHNRCTTFHFGAGLDDPRNQDVGFITNGINDPGQRLYNSIVWSNVFYNVTETWELGFELSYRKTHYLNDASSSSGMIGHFRTSLAY